MFKLKLFPSQYTSVSSGYEDTHFPKDDYIFIGTDENGTKFRSLLIFDIDELPKNTFVISAKLTLYSEDMPATNNTNFTPYLVTSEWDRQTTWDVLPNVDLSKEGLLLKSNDISKFEWDITDITRKWVKHKINNYGLLLRSSEDGTKDFCRFPVQFSNVNKPCLKLSLYGFKEVNLSSRRVCSITKEYEVRKTPQYTDWFKVSEYSMYTFFIQNLGTNTVIMQVQISPDKKSVFNENAIYRVPKNGTAAIAPMLYTFYNRLLFKTIPPGKPSTIKVWFQAQV